MAGMLTKTEVNYNEPEASKKCCQKCDYYDYSRCQVVAGRIKDLGLCDKFEPRDKPKSGGEELVSDDLDAVAECD
jgi:hypothetical protein